MSATLEFQGVSKAFHGVPVLREVTFAVPDGTTLGLVGENGAGKSTLMNILGGNLRPDAGGMRLGGRPHAPSGPIAASKAGIRFVHQELNLFPNLTVAENLALDGFPRVAPWLPLIDRRRLRDRTGRLIDEVGLALAPDTPVERLTAGERQLVEIARALGGDARWIILDEPTTSLTARECSRLFEVMGRLHERGIGMIYISHNLADIRRLCDSVVVLRDGAVVDHRRARDVELGDLVARMVGREIQQLYPPPAAPPSSQVVLEVAGVSQPGVVRDIGFELRRGEILGISGLMGAGRSELARILFGLDPCARGSVRLLGEPIEGLPPGERLRRGLALVTEDRRADGLCLEASIRENLSLAALPRFARGPLGWVDAAAQAEAVTRIRGAVRLTEAARDGQPVRTLSGGNQQKVVLGKWLMTEPTVFVVDEPTRGIDVGARHEVYRLLRDLTARGAGVLMISSEIEELIGMCDRILVLGRGRIRDRLDRSEFDRERILRSALHGEGAG